MVDIHEIINRIRGSRKYRFFFWLLAAAATTPMIAVMAIMASTFIFNVSLSYTNTLLTIFLFLFINYEILAVVPRKKQDKEYPFIVDHLCIMARVGAESEFGTIFMRESEPDFLDYNAQNMSGWTEEILPWFTLAILLYVPYSIIVSSSIIGLIDIVINVEGVWRFIIELFVYGGAVGAIISASYWLRLLLRTYSRYHSWRKFWASYWLYIWASLVKSEEYLAGIEASRWENLFEKKNWSKMENGSNKKDYDLLRKKTQETLDRFGLVATLPTSNEELETYVDKLVIYSWLRNYINEKSLEDIEELRGDIEDIEKNKVDLLIITKDELARWHLHLTTFNLAKESPILRKEIADTIRCYTYPAERSSLKCQAKNNLRYISSLSDYPKPKTANWAYSLVTFIPLLVALVPIFFS